MTIITLPALESPTAALPPIGRIRGASIEKLQESLRYLRLVYSPEVRGSRRVNRKTHSQSSSLRSGTDRDEELGALRSDAFERSYAIRWLTSLIAQVEVMELEGSSDSTSFESIIQTAASLLSICAGTSAAGSVTRSFSFGHGTGEVTVQLTDAPLENQDFGTVGVQTWGSACVLAEMLVEMPEHFDLNLGHVTGERLRVLELGAGTGLVSLTVGKLLQQVCTQRLAEIIASDFHPSTLSNLNLNIASNFPSTSATSSSVVLSAHKLDWSDTVTLDKHLVPFDDSFDLIFGADIIYEAEHALWIRSCLERLLRRPSATQSRTTPSAQFHLVIPLRPTFAIESSTIEQVFPFLRNLDALQDGCSALHISHKEIILCEAQPGVVGEVEYAYYIIQWAAR
ncbi:hypothetical protein HETIRDRAFT_387896 [Heterobasidion irregulare TC 32-1]|uniref:Uncharacterized protein n=1 Tax=Heterobasidion irregulare (strain TC 32-1) TaxID=747525 RepID=W4JYC0_HETIT|nr:uncharacterized protein HETIRDRAFT_387896 [Heterobasidion irregulare TC 32-1]ETW77851.1 hypothetical protein HETIRDRAFT_387896 [Heterobasidion irregulare TC 32-1]